jgi:hypothetical protein
MDSKQHTEREHELVQTTLDRSARMIEDNKITIARTKALLRKMGRMVKAGVEFVQSSSHRR